MGKKIRITLERDKCIGCGTCASICPKFFEMKNGFACLKNPLSKENRGAESVSKSELELFVDASDEDLSRLERAVKSCPVKIINVEKNQ